MQEGEDPGGKVARSREMSPLGDGMSIKSSSPGGVRPPRAAPHPMRLQALTLWPEEDPVAGLVAVRLSVVLRRAEREACHWGRGAGERPVPRTHPPYWAPLPLCSSPEDTCTPARPQGCSCQPCPALLQKQGLPNRHGTAQHSAAHPWHAGIPHARCLGVSGPGHPYLSVAPRGQRLAAALAA